MELSLHVISKYGRFSIWLKSYVYCISYSSFWSTVLCNVNLDIFSFLFVTKNNFFDNLKMDVVVIVIHITHT
jgi:hypothetical protein